MKTKFAALLFTFMFAVSPFCMAQAPQQTMPTSEKMPISAEPPTEALTRFSSFLGLYEFSGDFAGEMYLGTLEVKPAVKGWYVEWVINVSVSMEGELYDRQLRMITTWDRFAEQYRIWRFETNSPVVMGEGTAMFKDGEFVMEWDSTSPDGKKGTFRNRVKMNAPGEIIIISEGQQRGGEVDEVGIGTGKRLL